LQLHVQIAETSIEAIAVDELAADAGIIRAAMQAQRRRLSALRAAGTIGDDAFHQVEAELDLFELDLEQVLRTVESRA
jgi:hypothetical protein